MDAMDRFVNRENIDRYRRLANESADATDRLQLMKLPAEEEAKFKSELSRRGDAPAGRSRVTAATEHRVKHDGEEQHSGG
jgi:hypothetical protein